WSVVFYNFILLMLHLSENYSVLFLSSLILRHPFIIPRSEQFKLQFLSFLAETWHSLAAIGDVHFPARSDLVGLGMDIEVAIPSAIRTMDIPNVVSFI